MLRLRSEIQELVRTIVKEYPSPTLASEGIPQGFPTKGAAQVFGERWSKGDRNSFSAKSVDADGNDENHPKFDNTSVRSGRLKASVVLRHERRTRLSLVSTGSPDC